jgi:hypothetical protein
MSLLQGLLNGSKKESEPHGSWTSASLYEPPEVAPLPSHRVTCDGWSALMQPMRALRVTLRHMLGSANKNLTRRYSSSQFQRRSCSVCNGNGGLTKPSKYRYLRVVRVLTLFMGRVYTTPCPSKRSGRSATTMIVHLGKDKKLIICLKRRSLVSSESPNPQSCTI